MKKEFQDVIDQASTVILDKRNEIELAMVCLMAGGHLLIEDAPGVGKTTLIQTLAKLCGLDTKRIQFTVDLMPADILGGQLYNPQSQSFEFKPGPIFCQMLLADELNRTSPRTQGALLQAMEEYEVALEGVTYPLPYPFFVIATQNPLQHAGTFGLPDSQLDRFLMSLELKYAKPEIEMKLFQMQDSKSPLSRLQPILNAEQFKLFQSEVQKIHVSELVAQYVSNLLQASRNSTLLFSPLSTRAGLSLVKTAKAWAYISGRNFVSPDDIQKVIVPVFGHRLGGNHGLQKGREWAAELQNKTQVPF